MPPSKPLILLDPQTLPSIVKYFSIAKGSRTLSPGPRSQPTSLPFFRSATTARYDARCDVKLSKSVCYDSNVRKSVSDVDTSDDPTRSANEFYGFISVA